MIIKTLLLSISVLLLTGLLKTPLNGQATMDFETGAVYTGYNDVRIPGDQGTPFSLKDDLVPKTKLFYRIRLNYTIKSRHTFSLLYAPLEIKSEGRCHMRFFSKE